MNTLKNARRALPLFAAAALPLILMTHDRTASAQTPPPAASWTQVGVFVRNTVAAVKHDLEGLAGEFPELARFGVEAKTDQDSLSYAQGGVRVAVRFRYPLGREDADKLDASWRVYRLKNGRLLGAWSHVSAADDERGRLLGRLIVGVVRAKEAELLDHAGADTRGGARDLGAERYDGRLERGRFYRTEITYDRERGGWVTTVAARSPYHHAARIEWLNAGHFPGLYSARPPGARVEVVFQVAAVKRERVTARRWNTTYECRVVGVEGGEAPRAEYLTLVAACRRVRATGKRNPGLYFTFEVRRVAAGGFAAPEFTVELTGETGAYDLLRAVGGTGVRRRDGDCDSSREVEMTFEVTDTERQPRRPGVLQEFRVIE